MAKSPSFQRGQKIRVFVEEALGADALIVNFEGHLFRVSNETGLKFKKGHSLMLLVTQTSPLVCKIAERQSFQFERFA